MPAVVEHHAIEVDMAYVIHAQVEKRYTQSDHLPGVLEIY
jgi:hypothetical protein